MSVARSVRRSVVSGRPSVGWAVGGHGRTSRTSRTRRGPARKSPVRKGVASPPTLMKFAKTLKAAPRGPVRVGTVLAMRRRSGLADGRAWPARPRLQRAGRPARGRRVRPSRRSSGPRRRSRLPTRPPRTRPPRRSCRRTRPRRMETAGGRAAGGRGRAQRRGARDRGRRRRGGRRRRAAARAGFPLPHRESAHRLRRHQFAAVRRRVGALRCCGASLPHRGRGLLALGAGVLRDAALAKRLRHIEGHTWDRVDDEPLRRELLEATA